MLCFCCPTELGRKCSWCQQFKVCWSPLCFWFSQELKHGSNDISVAQLSGKNDNASINRDTVLQMLCLYMDRKYRKPSKGHLPERHPRYLVVLPFVRVWVHSWLYTWFHIKQGCSGEGENVCAYAVYFFLTIHLYKIVFLTCLLSN